MVKLETKFGTIGFDCSENGLCRVELTPSKKDLRPAKSVQEKKVLAAFKGYLAGRRYALELDLGSVTPFARKVLNICYAIPRGKVVSYGELARKAGRPKAARAVGRVMARNPLAVVIPCHRVVGSDGSLHGFGGGLPMKRRMLELEGVCIRNDRVVL
jgi:methylated-DNA-[protein]-cysteine S-methyltransferase